MQFHRRRTVYSLLSNNHKVTDLMYFMTKNAVLSSCDAMTLNNKNETGSVRIKVVTRHVHETTAAAEKAVSNTYSEFVSLGLLT